MWVRVMDSTKEVNGMVGVETMHLQTRLFGGVDVVRGVVFRRGRSPLKSVESFDSHAEAECHVRKVLADDGFHAVGESV